MLSSQGLPAPATVAVTLPADIGGFDGWENDTESPDTLSGTPVIVVVGSHDTRKNHLAVLHAAEMLWKEGLDFRLTFIGGGGSNREFLRQIEMLSFRGRPVEVRTAVPDNELKAAISAARFTVFPSLHEGYGLPVAESMALGTPVITTDYGATAEIAHGGGHDRSARRCGIDRCDAPVAHRRLRDHTFARGNSPTRRKELAGLCRRAMGSRC
jgi:glycosyltransferase involved in cell wall biosynthesis